MIVWSIERAHEVDGLCDVLVSTDDEEIANVSIGAGALVPWLRPAELAGDSTSSVDVALHALDWYQRVNGNVDGMLLLQPTSPFRTRATIQSGLDLFGEHSGASVIGVSPAASHPLWTFKIDGGRMFPYVDNHAIGIRSQDLPPVFVVNGSLYLSTPHNLRASRSFLGDAPIPLVISAPEESLDIDTEWDWRIAEYVVALRQKQLP